MVAGGVVYYVKKKDQERWDVLGSSFIIAKIIHKCLVLIGYKTIRCPYTILIRKHMLNLKMTIGGKCSPCM